MEQPIPVADLIILIASGTARVEYFNEQIDSFISSTNKNLPENLFAAAYPVTYLQLKQGIASTALVADSTTNISESQRVLIRPHPIPPFETVTGLDGNKNPHLSWISTEFKLSPNVATLFHANTLIRSHLSPTCTPGINIRYVELRRIYSEYSSSNENRGIIGTLIGLNDVRYDHSITHNKYSFWPYKMANSKNDHLSTCLPVQTCLSNYRIKSDPREHGQVFAKLVTIDDIVDLIDLLSVVSINKVSNSMFAGR